MNPIVEEMLAIMDYDEDDALIHYGMPRRSGRYPWGSGDDPYQRSIDFMGRVNEYKKQGMSEREIAETMGILNNKGQPSVSKLRDQYSIAKNEKTLYQTATARRLHEKEGMGYTEIGRQMGVRESTVRSWLEGKSEKNAIQAKNTAEFLKKRMKETDSFLDVGEATNLELNITEKKMSEALTILENEGYKVYSNRIDQSNNSGHKTTQKLLCPPGTEYKDIYNKDAKIASVTEYTSHDGGETFDKFVYPKSLDSSRLKIRYADEIGPDGARGIDKDGIVEIRRGVDDLSLNGSHYSQVRILVDGDRYIKGMAVYSDNMPDGVDVIFNTNKTPDKGMRDVLKETKKDPDNPFGSLIKAGGQSYYIDKNGDKQLSCINKTREEGDWSDWQDKLPSQFLSKQSRTLAKKQLDLAKADKLAEYDEICSITNPTIKKHLLQKFSDECDASAVDLKAAALPGQKHHVIIPINTLKDNEVYAPGYDDGTKLALIRYPHAGTFEIPVLTVNNKNKLGKGIIGTDTMDAVGINKKIADRLSGADFDGDTVMAIPTHDPKGKVKIKSTEALEDLKDFEPKAAYPERPGMRYMKDPVTGVDNTQKEMGVISNLITDMTLLGASDAEMARAVKHSMVVIDAAKHKLDYKKSEIDNNIAALKKDYQRTIDPDTGEVKTGGASTLISRAKGQASVDKRQGTPRVNMKGNKDYDPTKPEGAYLYKKADDLYYAEGKKDKTTGIATYRTTDGKKITYDTKDPAAREKYAPVKKVDPNTGEVTFTNKAGDISYRVRARTQKSTQMAETDDARTLISAAHHPMEVIYADYANSMKALANQSRKEMMTTKDIPYSAQAKAVYQKEVDSLNYKLNEALKNKPKERAALRQANAEVARKVEDDPTLSKKDIGKLKTQATTRARSDVGSIARKDRNIDITDREWEAIQAGAISKSKLIDILNNTDVDKLRERAMPKATTTLSKSQISRIKALSNSNYTIAEIAKKLGKSPSTISKYLKGGN